MKNKTVNEMLESKTTILPLKLQFFADGGEDDNKDDDSNNDDDDSDDDDSDDNNEDDEKKFTQKDLTNIATKEKKQGRKSAFKEMGFKSEEEAKEQLEAFRQWQASQLTDEQKKQKEIDDANSGKSDAEERARIAEEKLSVVIAGVRKDSVDDVLAIARAKVTDEKTLDEVLGEMKKEERYKSFFDSLDDSANSGTGTNLSHKRGKGGKENIGARLGKQQTGNTQQSKYFSN